MSSRAAGRWFAIGASIPAALIAGVDGRIVALLVVVIGLYAGVRYARHRKEQAILDDVRRRQDAYEASLAKKAQAPEGR
ncbi:MAG: hypothetical protein AAF645_11305 [Myxococcota bacterium]